MTADPGAGRGQLRPTLRGPGVVGLTLSALSPAASVYVTGSAILHLAGTGAVIAVLGGGAAILLASLLYAEIGAAYPAAGGVYPGIGAILGPSAARVAIVLGLITSPALLAFIALGLADYAGGYLPLVPRPLIAPGVIAAACLVAAANLRTSTRVAMMLLLVELLALAMLVGVGATHPARSIAEVLTHPVMIDGAGRLVATPLPTLLLATVSGAFACAGSGLALYFAEDMTGPPQRIGWLVVVTGTITVALVALPLLFFATGARDLAAALRLDLPIAAFIADRAGPTAAVATVGAVMLAIFNNLVASAIAFGRFLYATGMDGIWPDPVGRRLARLHPRRGSPTFAVATLFAASLLACLAGQRALLALLSAEVFTALLLVVAIVVGRRRQLTGETSFRSPLFPLAPVLALLVIAAFLILDWHDRDHGRVAVLLLGAVAGCTFVGDLLHRRATESRRPRAPVDAGP